MGARRFFGDVAGCVRPRRLHACRLSNHLLALLKAAVSLELNKTGDHRRRRQMERHNGQEPCSSWRETPVKLHSSSPQRGSLSVDVNLTFLERDHDSSSPPAPDEKYRHGGGVVKRNNQKKFVFEKKSTKVPTPSSMRKERFSELASPA
jgi:hypothetical protein